MKFIRDDKNYKRAISKDGNIAIELDYSSGDNKRICYSGPNNINEYLLISDERNGHCTIYLKDTTKPEIVLAIESAGECLGFKNINFEMI